MTKSAVVTGIGVIAPNGLGTEQYWAATLAGRSGIGPVSRFDPVGYPVRLGGEVRGFTAAEHVPSRLIPQTDNWTHFGLVAAAWALNDAAADPAAFPEYEMAVVTASSSGGTEFGQREIERLWSKGPEWVGAYQSIAWFYAATTGQISIRHGMRGPCGVICAEQAGALEAAGQARHLIQQGTRLVITGGTDASLCPYGVIAQHSNGRLSESDDPDRAYLPFGTDAAGYVPGEGGAMLVIENAADARARCAPHIYGEIIGQAATFDPRPGSGREPGLRRAMELALADAGLTAGDIDVLFADAAGVPELDRCEAAAISSVFGPAGVPVTAPKTMTGRLNGGGAALDLATALLSMRDGVIPPTTGVTDLAPDCAIDLVRAKPRQAEIRTAMVTARGYGGFNTAIVLKKPQLKEIKMPEFAVNSSFTLNDLREVMRTCAGIDESVDLDSDIGGRTFEDLGYDSLAVLEMTAKIQNMLGVVITDDAARELTTPQSLVDHVAAQLTGHQAAISQLCSRRLRRTSWQDTLTTRLSLTRPWTSSGK